MAITEGTEHRLASLFPEEDRAEARRLLETGCGRNLPLLEQASAAELERVQFAALKVSGGELTRLREAVHLAQQDWRDLLVAAGFANSETAHQAWYPS